MKPIYIKIQDTIPITIGKIISNLQIISKVTILLFIILHSTHFSSFAQAPDKMSYQAVIRNASGTLVKNTSVGIKISAIQGSASGTVVYTETHSATTNESGLVTIEIGGGTIVTGGFANINWTIGPYFLKTEIDPTGGNNYTISGVGQLLSVPYSLYAKTSENAITAAQAEAIIANTAKISYPAKDASKLAGIDGSETKVTAGTNVIITGEGTSLNPYLIRATIEGGGTHFIGELYQGGVVFYVDQTGAHGLICSMIDLTASSLWSDVSSYIGPAAQSDWNGQSNTNAIVAQSISTSAADLCDNYINSDYGTGVYTDWYLPAIDDLNILFNARRFVSKTLDSDNDGTTTSLNKTNYWSSTENGGNFAWIYSFITGNPNVNNKNLTNNVRAIRAF
jgi:hypothetical protein